MADDRKLAEKWNEFRPSKTTWFWTMAGAAVAAIAIGFTFGGWTTGGTAREMANDAAQDARAQLAATLCVENFVSAPDANSNWAELKETTSYQQDNYIEDGGWAMLEGMEDLVNGATDICADRLVAMEALPARNAEIAPATTDG